MRTRYFSPDSINSSILNQNTKPSKLRWAGSTTKLHSYHSMIEQSQKKIGHYIYSTSQQIGSGYSSKVYKAHSTKDKDEYAIKIIQLKKYSQSSLQMLENEIQILKTLDHPNVIKCYDVYKTATHCFIITQFCSNGDLLNYLTRRVKLTENVVIQIMAEVIEGVKYLLNKGILHRDLKPANIISNKQNWKIADFGFSMYADKQIKTKYNVGTPLYMPPESLVNNIYSPQTDIFSIGIIFYELLTGVTPWQCKSERELIKKMKLLPFSISQRHKIGTKVRNILEKLCSIDTSKRITKEQFLQLNIKMDQNPEETKKNIELNLKRSTSENTMKETIYKNLSSKIIRKNVSIEQKAGNKKSSIIKNKSIQVSNQTIQNNKIDTKNNHILINQLHFCRFIYYLIKNNSSFLLSPKHKIKLCLILHKHLQKLIKLLADNKNNWFKLNNWDLFKQSKKYYTTLLTMKEYLHRYDKQYMNFLRNTDQDMVKEINKDVEAMSANIEMSTDFYNNVLKMIAPVMRQFNHNIMIQTKNEQVQLTPQIKGSIEAIKSIYKYYQLLKLSILEFENYELFQKKSDIKVQIDYKTVNSTISQFMQLRKELKSI